jgi:hypothetical protein
MSSKEVARKNDLMRSTFIGCRVVMTKAVSEAPNKEDVLSAVRNFKEFTRDNNPHGENDFAFFEVDGERYFFKFDYYDDDYEYFKEDGNRVLMIGFANEY